MSEILCPHCSVTNELTARFCESCGNALPDANASGPRIVADSGIAATGAGQTLQDAELRKKMKSASGALLAVAILQFIGAILFYFLLGAIGDDPSGQFDPSMQLVVPVIMGIIGLVYVGLWWWARKSPFPAALVGLILFCTLWLVDILADPAGFYRGIIIKVIILAVLIKAVSAGSQHRKLKQAVVSAS